MYRIIPIPLHPKSNLMIKNITLPHKGNCKKSVLSKKDGTFFFTNKNK